MLPILQRELRTAVRNPKFYRWRIRMAVVELIAAFFIISGDTPLGRPRGRGGFFWFLSWVAFLFCFFEGLRKTSDAISEEKREGTLGLLFLTDLKGFDIMGGKLAGAMVRSFNALLIFVPILAITLIVGGTTLGEFWRIVLALGNTLWVSLSLCLFASCISREKHLGSSLAFLGFFTLAPFLVGEGLRLTHSSWMAQVRSLSPLMTFTNASDAYYSIAPSNFWLGTAVQNVIGWLAVVAASLVVPHSWKDKPAKQTSKIRSRTLGTVEVVRAKRRELLDRHPILWLTYNERHHRTFNLLFYTSLVLSLGAVLFASYLFNSSSAAYIVPLGLLTLLLFVHLASQSSINLAEAKRTGAMELLLSTPLKVANITEGQWLALRKIFFFPTLILFISYLSLFVVSVYKATANDRFISAVVFSGKYLAEFALGFFVVAWVGMWMGLTSKTPNRAFFRTILFGLIVPYTVCLPTLVNQVVLLLIAKDKVKYNFRRFIAERYLQAPGFILPPALTGEPNTPPVIR